MRNILLLILALTFTFFTYSQSFTVSTVPPLNGGNGSTGVTFNVSTNKNITITGLLPSTTYNWSVKAICGASNSGNGSTSTFTTGQQTTCNTPIGLDYADQRVPISEQIISYLTPNVKLYSVLPHG